MKNVSDSRLMRLSFGVLGLMAGAGLAAGYMTFADYSRQIETNEHSTELTQIMVEAVHSDQLLRKLNNAEQEQAKMQLKSALAYELAAIRSLAPTADKSRQDGAKAFLAEIGREQRAHPEYYLASYRKSGVDQSGDLQVVQH